MGGALSDVCNESTGNCDCRQNIAGRQCDVAAAGYYVPAYDFLTFEAEFQDFATVNLQLISVQQIKCKTI